MGTIVAQTCTLMYIPPDCSVFVHWNDIFWLGLNCTSYERCVCMCVCPMYRVGTQECHVSLYLLVITLKSHSHRSCSWTIIQSVLPASTMFLIVKQLVACVKLRYLVPNICAEKQKCMCRCVCVRFLLDLVWFSLPTPIYCWSCGSITWPTIIIFATLTVIVTMAMCPFHI